jgi:hypothetical protein
MSVAVEMKINEELNGIELYFSNKPSEEIRSVLKENKFRWSGFKKCWYTKQSEKAFKVANSLVNGKTVQKDTEVKNAAKKHTKKTFNLWNAVQWEDIKVNGEQETKQIAKEIRSHIRKRFPQCKFSVRVPYYGYISFKIVASPYEKDSVYLNYIKEYCEKLLNAYRICYDEPDYYTDYAGHYNFSGTVSIDYDYIQTDVTEEIQTDMENFDLKLVKYKKAEEERKQKEYEEWKRQQELKEIEYKKKQEERKKKVENIYNSVDVKELEENEQYFIVGAEFANLNKNNTIQEYIKEVEKGDYTKQNVKITREIHFTDQQALEDFSNMLLADFDFLEGAGGSYTDDNRINSMLDYYNMDESEQSSIQWNLSGVAVYFDNKLQFVIDPQGYSYARYVGLTNNAIKQTKLIQKQLLQGEELEKLRQHANLLEDISCSVLESLNIVKTWNNDNWKEYKEEMKKQLKHHNIKLNKSIVQQIDIEELKESMYKLLTEVDGIQEQFKAANLQKGEKVTIFHISDWGILTTNRVIIDNIEYKSYAQYDNAVKLTYKPEGKRKLYYNYYHNELLIYRGWLDLPDTVLHEIEERNGMKITRSKYHMTDHRQYDEIIKYFEQQGLMPIVNTYKPIF